MRNRKFSAVLVATLSLATLAFAGTLRAPQIVTAGAGATIQSDGSGEATMTLFGPGSVVKRKVQRGSIALRGDELRQAGQYTIVVDGDSASFFVTPAQVEKIAFVARPSRVPAAAPGAVSGSAFLFDKYQNLVLEPARVSFSLAVEGAPAEKKDATSKDGVAWVQLNSGRKGGPAQFIASAGSATARRVVQQVASDPCSIRMKAGKAPDGNILVETDPIRDCSGNPVPDGTIVTFTSVDPSGRSTVDARIKRGVAKAELPATNSATLSVAAGVVLGNEVRWGGGQ